MVTGPMLRTKILQAFEEFDVGLAILDAAGRIEVWNGWLGRASGRLAREVETRTVREAFPAASARLTGAIEQATRQGMASILSSRLNRLPPLPLVRPDDDRPLIFQKVLVRPLFHGDRIVPDGCLLQVFDETPAADREALLRQNERRYRTIVRNIPNSVVAVFDRNLWFSSIDGLGVGFFGAGIEPGQGCGIDWWPSAFHDFFRSDLPKLFQGETLFRSISFANRNFDVHIVPLHRIGTAVTEGLMVIQDVTDLRAVQAQLTQMNALLKQQSETDSLLEIANRRRLDAELAREWNRCARGGYPLSFLLIDVDHFKAFNDRYGHQAGDECLKQITRAIAGQLKRPGDLLARYGGEELGALLPGTLPADAAEVAERVRQAVAACAIPHETSETADVVTVSVGVSGGYPTYGAKPAELVRSADWALYAAKNQGRNCVVSMAMEETPAPHQPTN